MTTKAQQFFVLFVLGILCLSVVAAAGDDDFGFGGGGDDGFGFGGGGDDGFGFGGGGDDGFGFGGGGDDDFGFGGNDPPNNPPPGGGDDTGGNFGGNGGGNDGSSGGNDFGFQPTNQAAQWNALTGQTIRKNSPAGTIVYPNLVGQCDDSDDPEFVTVASTHNSYRLFVSGSDLAIDNLAQNHIGAETVTVDCNGVRAAFTLTISAIPNAAPVFQSIGDRTLTEGQTLEFQVNATDADNDVLTYSATGLPNGALFNTQTRTFSWTPSSSQVGVSTVTFTVDDAFGGVTSQSVRITVLRANRAPLIISQPITIGTVGVLYQYPVQATDADGDSLTFSLQQAPFGMTINSATGLITWVPAQNQQGNSAITLAVSDGKASSQQLYTIMVQRPQNAPVLAFIGDRTMFEGQLLQFQLNATDADGDALTFFTFGLPLGSNLTSSGLFNWMPTFDQGGAYSVTFAVSDGRGGFDFETIRITVVDVTNPQKVSEPQMGVVFSRIRIPSEYVQPGGQVEFNIEIDNNEDIKLEDLRVEVIVYDWGESRSVGPFDLRRGQQTSRHIVLDVPEDVVTGDYDVRIVASNDDMSHTTHRIVTVV